MRQVTARIAVMKVEAASAMGMPLLPKLVVPPKWVCAAIRIIFTGKPVLGSQKLSLAETVQGFGALSGMAKTWEAFLNSPTSEMTELEKKYSAATEMRLELKRLTTPSLKVTRRTHRAFEKAPLKPAIRAAYLKGQGEAAESLLDEAGELKDDSNIRSDVCYFIWLYWPEIRRLSSVRELEKFFAEMRQDTVTKKNLEKICREIGLKFKGKGRPKNLFKGNSK